MKGFLYAGPLPCPHTGPVVVVVRDRSGPGSYLPQHAMKSRGVHRHSAHKSDSGHRMHSEAAWACPGGGRSPVQLHASPAKRTLGRRNGEQPEKPPHERSGSGASLRKWTRAHLRRPGGASKGGNRQCGAGKVAAKPPVRHTGGGRHGGAVPSPRPAYIAAKAAGDPTTQGKRGHAPAPVKRHGAGAGDRAQSGPVIVQTRPAGLCSLGSPPPSGRAPRRAAAPQAGSAQ